MESINAKRWRSIDMSTRSLPEESLEQHSHPPPAQLPDWTLNSLAFGLEVETPMLRCPISNAA